ncbi:lanthionine synthetase C family protein [Pseudofrankia sp. BMG5.36]|uniref:lanthionine synthetase C family protein n=1 Tax=Pseudofrankia sp. BMG5.36 TaxID=1834512 RepID=UPI0008D9DC3F|nr:lanthionine synthetase C family protein [Pseudofrankia sp. BMG5.36]OHV63459.1 lantibiotic modifying enzyme [Pseudofrankia sp. BMG5.36]
MTAVRARALAMVAAIADRLADPAAVPPGPGRRRGQSLAGGAAGIALLHIERARTGHGDWSTAQAWLREATAEPISAGPNATLYFGAPALAFVTHTAVNRPGQLRDALATLDAATVAITRRRLTAAHARLRAAGRPPLAEFDLIRGLAGLGSYHLRRGHPITVDILAYLTQLTEPQPDGLPGWWTDVDPSGAPSTDYPTGHGNAGMSHGIAAPLALLATAVLHNIEVDGQLAAIERICAWLDQCQQASPSDAWWPGIVTEPQARPGETQTASRRPPSWCYGLPGIARAYQLAALATGDTARRHTAETALLTCLRDSNQLDLLTEPGLCHGLAGLIQTAHRAAADATTPELAAELPGLVERLLARLPTQLAADPELLDGLAGAALALHTAATNTSPATGWDAALLLT